MQSIAIQSVIENLMQVEDFLTCFCDDSHINNYFATISVPVLQAVENAIVHGNKGDACRQVRIEAGNCKGGVYFTIEDEGVGFDYQKYCREDFVESQGIFLIKTLSDKIEYSEGGRKLRLEFEINGIDGVESLERIVKLQKFSVRKSIVA